MAQAKGCDWGCLIKDSFSWLSSSNSCLNAYDPIDFIWHSFSRRDGWMSAAQSHRWPQGFLQWGVRCGFERQRASTLAHLCNTASRPCVRGEGVLALWLCLQRGQPCSVLSSLNKRLRSSYQVKIPECKSQLGQSWAVQPFIGYFFVVASDAKGTRQCTKKPRRGWMPLWSSGPKWNYLTLISRRYLTGPAWVLSKSWSPLRARAGCYNLERWTAWRLWQVISCRKDNKIFVYLRQMEGRVTEAWGEAGTFLIIRGRLLTFTDQQSWLNVATAAIAPVEGTAKLPWQRLLLRGSQTGFWPSQPKFLLCFPLPHCPSSWLKKTKSSP